MKRRPSAWERELWQLTIRGVQPLPRIVRKLVSTVPPAPLSSKLVEPAVSKEIATAPAGRARGRSVAEEYLARIRRGHVRIDGRLDLHGMTEAMAHEALKAFVARLNERKARLGLVITGRGRADAGVLRRHVPLWLETAAFASDVVGSCAASLRHGGEGALYIIIR